MNLSGLGSIDLSVTALCAAYACSPYMPCGIAPGTPATGASRFLQAAAYLGEEIPMVVLLRFELRYPRL